MLERCGPGSGPVGRQLHWETPRKTNARIKVNFNISCAEFTAKFLFP